MDAAGNSARMRSASAASVSAATVDVNCSTRRISLDVEQVRHPHAARPRDAPEIVADHVDDHHVLGSLFLGFAQAFGLLEILLEPQAPRGGAFHRTRFDASAGTMEEELWRRAAHRPLACIDECAEWRVL